MFNRVNNYHSNILATELNPRHQLTNINGFYKLNIYLKSTKLPPPLTSKIQSALQKIQSMAIFIVQKASNFDEEIPLIKEKFKNADYPLRFINSVINEFQKVKKVS